MGQVEVDKDCILELRTLITTIMNRYGLTLSDILVFLMNYQWDDEGIFKPGNILHYKAAQEVYVMVIGDGAVKGRGSDRTSFASIILSGSLGGYERGDVLIEYKHGPWKLSSLQDMLRHHEATRHEKS